MNERTKRTAWFLAFLVLVAAVEAPIRARDIGGIPLKCGPSLSIGEFTAIPDPAGTTNGGPQPGGELRYEIRISNNSGLGAENVTLDLDLPPELSIHSSDHEAKRSGTHWDLGRIEDTGHVDVYVFMNVAKTAVHNTEMTTTATASADDADPATVHEENTTTADGLCDAPPASGTWLIAKNCTFAGLAAVPGAVEVNADKVLTIAPSAILEIDLKTYRLKVTASGGVMVKDGGTIRQKTGTL